VINGEAEVVLVTRLSGYGRPPENRLLVPDVSRAATARRDREHDQAEPNHHHSHEFESKGVHGNSPR
jgi:hypothetical protein